MPRCSEETRPGRWFSSRRNHYDRQSQLPGGARRQRWQEEPCVQDRVRRRRAIRAARLRVSVQRPQWGGGVGQHFSDNALALARKKIRGPMPPGSSKGSYKSKRICRTREFSRSRHAIAAQSLRRQLRGSPAPGEQLRPDRVLSDMPLESACSS